LFYTSEWLLPLIAMEQTETANGEDYLPKHFATPVQDMAKSDRRQVNGYGKGGANSIPYFQPQVSSNGSSNSDMTLGNMQSLRMPNSKHDQSQPDTGIISPVSQNGLSDDDYCTDAGKNRMSGSGPPVVYPWMKRIHVSHGTLQRSYKYNFVHT